MAKKHTFQYSRKPKKLRQKEKAKLKFKNSLIESSWKHGLSVKSNFDRLGLAYDPNEVLKISSRSGFKESSNEDEESARIRKPTAVVEALESCAKVKKTLPVYMSEDDQLFCIYNIELYGDNFLAMNRDTRNVYQLTPKQIARLIERFKRTKRYEQYLMEKENGSLNVDEIYETVVA